MARIGERSGKSEATATETAAIKIALLNFSLLISLTGQKSLSNTRQKKLRTAECSGDRRNECVECYCTKVHPVCWPAPSAVDWHQPTHTHRSLVFNVLIYIYYLLIIFKSMPPALLIFLFFSFARDKLMAMGRRGKTNVNLQPTTKTTGELLL